MGHATINRMKLGKEENLIKSRKFRLCPPQHHSLDIEMRDGNHNGNNPLLQSTELFGRQNKTIKRLKLVVKCREFIVLRKSFSDTQRIAIHLIDVFTNSNNVLHPPNI